jgi:AraC-like DNA-binding protein
VVNPAENPHRAESQQKKRLKKYPVRYFFCQKRISTQAADMTSTPNDFIQTMRKLRDPARVEDYFCGEVIDWARVPNQLQVFARRTLTQLHGGAAQTFAHSQCVILAAVAEGGALRLDGVPVRLNTGDALLIFPYQTHFFYQLDQPEVDWLVIQFSVGNLQPWLELRSKAVPLSGRALELLAELTTSRVKRTAETALSKVQEGAHAYQVLIEMLSQVGGASAEAPADTDSIYAKVSDYALRHERERFTMAQMANELGYSEGHLRQRFRQKYGQSLGRFLQKVRLDKAAAMLRSSDSAVSSVALECGFDSVYSFSRAFKNGVGLSPRAYRLRESGYPAGALGPG